MNQKAELFLRALRGRSEVYQFTGKYHKGTTDCENALIFCRSQTPKDQSAMAHIEIEYAHILESGLNDYDRARELIEMALKRVGRKRNLEIFAKCLSVLGSIFWHKGDFAKALECFQKVRRIQKQRNYLKGVGTASHNMGIVYWNKGELDTALRHLKEALAIFKKSNYQMGIGMASNNTGLVYYNKGDLRAALSYYQTSLHIFTEIGHKMGIGMSAGNIGTVYRVREKSHIALEYYHKYLSIAESIGDKRGLGIVSNNIGGIYFARGNLDTALRYYKKHLSISKDKGDRWGMSCAYGNMGIAYHDKGDLVTALQCYEKDLSLSKELRDKRGTGIASINMGRAFMDTGQYDAAKKILKDAEKIMENIGDKINLSNVYIHFSELAILQENRKTARQFAQRALSLARETGGKIQEVAALRMLGVASFGKTREQQKKALACFKHSIRIAEKQNLRLEQAKSLYELGKIFVKTNMRSDWVSIPCDFSLSTE